MNSYSKTAVVAYQKSQTNTINELALVIMLYEGTLRFLKQSIDSIERNRIEHAHLLITRSRDIIAELLSSVDKKKGGKIAIDLTALYVYMFRTLVEANLTKDKEKINQVIGLLESLLDGWKTTKQSNSDSIDEPLERIASLRADKARKSTSIYG
ncbi:MAG: flagellar export chaperone FliS [SAR324 cluster bacterium]|nr:flagellar export chaperone FliS [SAR324 cluster bacterium]